MESKGHQTAEPPQVSYGARGVNPERLQAIRDHAGRSILDVGCGSGAYVLELEDQYDIHGIDIKEFDPWGLRPERFSVRDVCNLPHPPLSAQTVVCFEVLEHVPDPGKVVGDLYRICSKNLILTVPNCAITPGMKASLITYYHWVDPTHTNFFTLDTISALCREAGFKAVKSSYINRINFAPLLSEAFDLSGVAGRLAARWLARRQRRPYYLTCLVVAEK